MSQPKSNHNVFMSFLEIWSHLAVNIRVRDRSIKIVQYGCQMLLSYYGSYLENEHLCTLKQLKYASSTSRKAFWLLKSFNHLGEVYRRFNKNLINPNSPIVEKIDFIEELFLVVYFFYENQIFLARAKFWNFCEASIDPYCNWAWFGGDLAFFLSSSLRAWNCYSNTKKIEKDIRNYLLQVSTPQVSGRFQLQSNRSDQTTDPLSEDSSPTSSPSDIIDTEKPLHPIVSPSDFTSLNSIPTVHHEVTAKEHQQLKCYLQELIRLNSERSDYNYSLIVATLELLVSARSVGLFKAIFQEDLCAGHAGLMGVLSSIVLIFKAYRNIIKEKYNK
mmetsp:Transcript_12158/g.12238  ORF Transcript_12158/g.12238 Transcript_12158/m.12238 type:complete len:331 (-) Transcript_12158:179-1171(-)